MSTSRAGRKPFVRNHYLPKWLHRLCNALLATLVVLMLLIYIFPWRLALIVGVALFLLVLCIDPSKFSFVEGIAGEDGYVDLNDES